MNETNKIKSLGGTKKYKNTNKPNKCNSFIKYWKGIFIYRHPLIKCKRTIQSRSLITL